MSNLTIEVLETLSEPRIGYLFKKNPIAKVYNDFFIMTSYELVGSGLTLDLGRIKTNDTQFNIILERDGTEHHKWFNGHLNFNCFFEMVKWIDYWRRQAWLEQNNSIHMKDYIGFAPIENSFNPYDNNIG